MQRYLAISWGASQGRETNGCNICSLFDPGAKTLPLHGRGGHDMHIAT